MVVIVGVRRCIHGSVGGLVYNSTTLRLTATDVTDRQIECFRQTETGMAH